MNEKHAHGFSNMKACFKIESCLSWNSTETMGKISIGQCRGVLMMFRVWIAHRLLDCDSLEYAEKPPLLMS